MWPSIRSGSNSNRIFGTALVLQWRINGVQSTRPQALAVLINPPHDHPEGMRILQAKTGANLLKTVAMHKKQRNTHTQIRFYIYKICDTSRYP